MPEPSIKELLDSVGINQSMLAKLMDTSRSSITRMKDIASPEVIKAIDEYKRLMTVEQSEAVPVPDHVDHDDATEDIVVNTGDYDVNSLNMVNHKNIALSRIAYGRGGQPIDVVAESFKLSVFAYNAEVQNTINHCVETGTSFKALRSC